MADIDIRYYYSTWKFSNFPLINGLLIRMGCFGIKLNNTKISVKISGISAKFSFIVEGLGLIILRPFSF